MAKLVDAWDLKSPACKGVPVRLRVRAPIKPCEIRYLKRSLRRSFFVFGPCNAPWELHGNLSRIFTHPLQSLHSPPKPSRFPRFPQHLPKKFLTFLKAIKNPVAGARFWGSAWASCRGLGRASCSMRIRSISGDGWRHAGQYIVFEKRTTSSRL